MTDKTQTADQKATEQTVEPQQKQESPSAVQVASPVLSSESDFNNGAEQTRKSSGKGDVFFYSFLAIILLAIVALVSYYFLNRDDKTESATVVVVDVGLLASAQLQDRIELLASPDEAAEAANQFLADINSITKEFSDAGYIVLNASSVLSYPGFVDATPMVAERLGISLGLEQ